MIIFSKFDHKSIFYHSSKYYPVYISYLNKSKTLKRELEIEYLQKSSPVLVGADSVFKKLAFSLFKNVLLKYMHSMLLLCTTNN